jgi:hypothetical protein
VLKETLAEFDRQHSSLVPVRADGIDGVLVTQAGEVVVTFLCGYPAKAGDRPPVMLLTLSAVAAQSLKAYLVEIESIPDKQPPKRDPQSLN